MKTVEVEDAAASLAQYVRGVKKKPVILTRKGKPVAALVSVEGADWESLSLSTNPRFMEIIEESRKQLRTEGGIPSAEVRRRFGLTKPPAGK